MPAAPAAEPAAQQPAVRRAISFTRLRFYCLMMFSLWAGEGGGEVKRAVEEMLDKKFGNHGNDAVAKACAAHPHFALLHKFFNMDVTVAVAPFVAWEKGDAAPFFACLPLVILKLISAGKAKVANTLILLLEHVSHWETSRPDIISFICRNCCAMNDQFIEFANCAISGMLPRVDIAFDYVRRMSILRSLKTEVLDKLLHSFGLQPRSRTDGRQEQEAAQPLAPRYRRTRNSVAVFFISEFERALSGEGSCKEAPHPELAALEGKLVAMRRRKKVETWGWEMALDERGAYHERLAGKKGQRSGDEGDAAKTVVVLKAELKALGQRTTGKKAELLVRLAAAKLADEILLVPQTAAEVAASLGVGELHAKVVTAAAVGQKK